MEIPLDEYSTARPNTETLEQQNFKGWNLYGPTEDKASAWSGSNQHLFSLSRNLHQVWSTTNRLAISKKAAKFLNHQACQLSQNIYVNRLKDSVLKHLLFPSRITQNLCIHWYSLRIHWMHFMHSLVTLHALTDYIINFHWVHLHWWEMLLLRPQHRLHCYTLRDHWYLGCSHILQNI